MTPVRKNSVGQLALIAALGLFTGGMPAATAADLGGNCCADLEERIAELEATTARKGNRKVSLTVSGWVDEAVFFWDDGTERNTYVGTNSLEQSRVKFTGDAKIEGNWSAGYTLEIGVTGHASNQWDQTDIGATGTTATDNALVVRKSSWFLKNKDYGKVTVGLDGAATYHLLDDGDGANTRYYSDAEAAPAAMGRFFLKSGGANLAGNRRWSDAFRGGNNGTPGQNGRREVVRYDSPAIMGFVATASWGEDDQAEAALTYKGDVGDFAVVARAGYAHNTDEKSTLCHAVQKSAADGAAVVGTTDCDWWGVAGTIMHKPTGLYVYAGYGAEKDNTRDQLVAAGNKPFVDDTDSLWFVQAGIEQKFIPLGKTTIFGEYRHDDAGSSIGTPNAASVSGITFRSSDLDNYAAGIVQNIDAAAMDLYVIYRHGDGDVVDGGGVVRSLDAMDMVITGARIQF